MTKSAFGLNLIAMKIWIYSLLSVFVVSLISLVGIFTIALNEQKLKKIFTFLVSFAVGGLFGDAFIHILPEAYEKAWAASNIEEKERQRVYNALDKYCDLDTKGMVEIVEKLEKMKLVIKYCVPKVPS